MRIKYTTTDKYKCDLKSIPSFQHPTNGAKFRVYINSKDNTFVVVDEIVDYIVYFGTASSHPNALIKAKKALERCGVKFEKEKRR